VTGPRIRPPCTSRKGGQPIEARRLGSGALRLTFENDGFASRFVDSNRARLDAGEGARST
jgi:hypothetical protein